MHAERDFSYELPLAAGAEELTRDLELETVWEAMAQDDNLILQVAKRALLRPLTDPDEIRYRQAILDDCLGNQDAIRVLYALAGEALAAPRSVWGSLSHSPRSVLGQSVRKLELLGDFLVQLREFAEKHAAKFDSAGLQRLCLMLEDELSRDYLDRVGAHLKELRFKDGILVSAVLTGGNRGTDYRLKRARQQGWLERLLDRSGHSFTISNRDQAGMLAFSELEDRATNLVANAIAQSVEHVVAFFVALRTELAFYIGCLNLNETLAGKSEPTTTPVPRPSAERRLSATGLRDVSLALTIATPVVANDLAADGMELVMITGANQGGKSTFLRSLGLAQLMMQAGMFVAAASFTASVATGLFTHYKREEDATLKSGKLDEELARMSTIADTIRPGALLLCNESFAATNEGEGSEIARQVIHALLDSGIRITFVTHLFDLADSFHRQPPAPTLFLRAERGDDGHRPFTLILAPPLPTSYGEDSYRKIFGHGLTCVSTGLDEAGGEPVGRRPFRVSAGDRRARDRDRGGGRGRPAMHEMSVPGSSGLHRETVGHRDLTAASACPGDMLGIGLHHDRRGPGVRWTGLQPVGD